MFHHEAEITIFDNGKKIQKYKFMLIVGIAGGTGSGKQPLLTR